MKPQSDAGAPSIDIGVLARMRRLDPSLHVTWNKHAMCPLTNTIIIAKNGMNPETGELFGGAVVDPCYHLWRQDDTSGHFHYVLAYPNFGYRQVLALERDVARFIDPRHIMRRTMDAQEVNRKRKLDTKKAEMQDIVRGNERKVMETIHGGRQQNTREGKIFSAPGVARRGSTGRVKMGSKEAGWDFVRERDGRDI